MIPRRGRRGSVVSLDRIKAWQEWESSSSPFAQAGRSTSDLRRQVLELSEADEMDEFKLWINRQMHKGYGEKNVVKDILVDLRDGTVMSRLLKFLEKRKFMPYLNRARFPWKQIKERPTLTFHIKQNLTQCFQFIKSYKDIRLFNIGIDDFQVHKSTVQFAQLGI